MRRVRNNGFSLIEMLMVVSLLVIASTVGVIKLKQSITLLDADKAANAVSGQLRYARQIALDDRRDVTVEFIDPDEIKVTRQDSPTPTLMADTRLPSGYRFGLASGVGDTPDAYGNAAAVDFNLQSSGIFRGDGVFTDGAGLVMNGSVFTVSSGNITARAVTLSGATGRTKTYVVSGASWITR